MKTALARKLPTEGRASPGYGHLGVWNFCLGPGSTIPGERLRIGIIDAEGMVVRRFEQILGECTDPGHVDFFDTFRCRPGRHDRPLVDIDRDGTIAKVLCPDYSQRMGMELFLQLLNEWANRHGKAEWALPTHQHLNTPMPHTDPARKSL